MVSIQFGVLEAAKRALVARHKAAGQSTELSVSEVAACGSLAGMSAGTVSSPVEHVRIRMQLQGSGPSPPGATAGAAVSTPPGARAFSAAAGPAYNGSIDAFRQIFKTYGFRGLYQGTSATMWREIIGYAGYFGAYEIVKRRFAAAQGEENLHVGHYLAAGSAAGFGMWIPAYPLDVIKSKMQADALTGQRKYPNVRVPARRRSAPLEVHPARFTCTADLALCPSHPGGGRCGWIFPWYGPLHGSRSTCKRRHFRGLRCVFAVAWALSASAHALLRVPCCTQNLA